MMSSIEGMGGVMPSGGTGGAQDPVARMVNNALNNPKISPEDKKIIRSVYDAYQKAEQKLKQTINSVQG